VHKVAQFFATGWPVNYWRIDPMTDDDFEWFEHKYPGWHTTSFKVGDYSSLGAQRAQADRLRGHRVRVSAPLLDLHGPVSDP